MKQLIQQFNLLYPLSAESQDALLKISREVTVEKNQNVQSIGQTCRTLYFVSKGVVRIYYLKNQTDITESFEFENSFVARAESLFTGKPSKKAIQALENSVLIAIDSTKLFALFEYHHDLERAFRKIIEAAYVNTVNRIESLQFQTAEERYNILLRENPDVLRRIPLKFVASYLGITQVSLSRIRGGK